MRLSNRHPVSAAVNQYLRPSPQEADVSVPQKDKGVAIQIFGFPAYDSTKYTKIEN